MKKQISAVLGAAFVIATAACGAAPTASESAVPGGAQANVAASDSAGRIPNMMGSGN